MDIEGFEWDVFATAEPQLLLKFSQIVSRLIVTGMVTVTVPVISSLTELWYSSNIKGKKTRQHMYFEMVFACGLWVFRATVRSSSFISRFYGSQSPRASTWCTRKP